MKKVKVWDCKIVVSGDAVLPNGFDSVPRKAVISAVENAGIEVLGCSSGWGGTLTKAEREMFDAISTEAYPDIYFAGLMDEITDDDIKH